MPTIQDQIEKLRKKIESCRALREDLGEAADQKIVELETQIQTLVETGGGAFTGGMSTPAVEISSGAIRTFITENVL